MTYRFRSDITKAVLPFGIIHTNQVTRQEAINSLRLIQKQAEKEGGNWLSLFVGFCLGNYQSWGAETILAELKRLEEDIKQLVLLTLASNTQTSEAKEQPNEPRD